MATSQVDKETKLTIRVNTGTASNPVYKNRILNHINPELTDDKFFSVASSIGGLQAHPVDKIIRTNTAVIENE